MTNTQNDDILSYYYHCLPYKSSPPTQEESERYSKMQNFLDALNRLPRFVVRLGRLARRQRPDSGFRFEQKMVDVLLSLDMVHTSLKGKITHVALVSGDSDYVPAVKMTKNESVSVWLFHGERPHNELWDSADERVRFTGDFIDSVLRKA